MLDVFFKNSISYNFHKEDDKRQSFQRHTCFEQMIIICEPPSSYTVRKTDLVHVYIFLIPPRKGEIGTNYK